MKKYSLKFFLSLGIVFFSLFFSTPSLFNLEKISPDWWYKNQIKLGLDLQGGSQLLLQIETQAAVKEKLQNYIEDIRTSLQNDQTPVQSIVVVNDSIEVTIKVDDYEVIKEKLKEFNFFDHF